MKKVFKEFITSDWVVTVICCLLLCFFAGCAICINYQYFGGMITFESLPVGAFTKHGLNVSLKLSVLRLVEAGLAADISASVIMHCIVLLLMSTFTILCWKSEIYDACFIIAMLREEIPAIHCGDQLHQPHYESLLDAEVARTCRSRFFPPARH